MSDERARVVLLSGPGSYRAAAFLEAAARLGLTAVHGLDIPGEHVTSRPDVLPLDFARTAESVQRLIEYARSHPTRAILSVDDSASLPAAEAAAALGFPTNDPSSALAASDKFVMRQRLAAGGVRVPDFQAVALNADLATLDAAFPSVVKPTRLNGSRGVIRVDGPDELATAFDRVRRMLLAEGWAETDEAIVIERYLPGVEVAVEGLLTEGELHVLAIFDKPDPLVGPLFEETIYVTPSRLPAAIQQEIAVVTERSAAALGLRHGPVHAELRINDEGVWPIELAGRSIGGLCSTILEFGAGMSLEELILRHAVGMELPSTERSGGAVGAMMIPIPAAGMLRSVDGQDAALAVPGITGLDITAPCNAPITPLPEGAAYLGFIFARGETPAFVEASLRAAHAALSIRIDPMITLSPVN
jgi:biotin carboxylase